MTKLTKIIKENLLPKITAITYIIVGALITWLIIYFRFIRERPHGQLDSTYTSLKFWFIILSMITTFLFLTYVLILPFYLNIIIQEYKDQKTTENRKFSALFAKALLYVSQSLKSFWSPIMNYIINNFPETFVSFLNTIMKINPYYKLIATIIYFLPPAIIAVTFLIETGYYKKYTYFPYSIFLMILPVVWRGTLYMFRYFCETIEEERYSKTIIQYGIDPTTNNPQYGWGPEAAKYGITEEELESPSSLFLEAYTKHKYRNYHKMLNTWIFYLVTSNTKTALQIFTCICLLTAACLKLAFLQ